RRVDSCPRSRRTSWAGRTQAASPVGSPAASEPPASGPAIPRAIRDPNADSAQAAAHPRGRVPAPRHRRLGPPPGPAPPERSSPDESVGLGTVTAVNGVGDKTGAVVAFGSAGSQRLLLRYAPIDKLN